MFLGAYPRIPEAAGGHPISVRARHPAPQRPYLDRARVREVRMQNGRTRREGLGQALVQVGPSPIGPPGPMSVRPFLTTPLIPGPAQSYETRPPEPAITIDIAKVTRQKSVIENEIETTQNVLDKQYVPPPEEAELQQRIDDLKDRHRQLSSVQQGLVNTVKTQPGLKQKILDDPTLMEKVMVDPAYRPLQQAIYENVHVDPYVGLWHDPFV